VHSGAQAIRLGPARDRQEVDDLVHDCLMRALDRLHTRRDEGDLRA
jgi:DNA-directed RNA polymerase specialized sigma24 family protein